MSLKNGSNRGNQRKTKRQAGDLACFGRLNVYLGLPLRKQLDFIAEREGRSLAYIIRVAVAALVESYSSNHELPKPKAEEYEGRKQGRPRLFQRVEE